ncbi:MAG: DUF2946 family protein [Steroidobacteraceae bacterium]
MLKSGRRRESWLAAIILASLILRALIPVGFMPGHSGLELCPGGGTMAGMQDHTRSHPSNTNRHAAPDQPPHSTEHSGGCVFAASAAGLAPPSVPPSVVFKVVTSERPSILATAGFFIPTLLRSQSPRGPPKFS